VLAAREPTALGTHVDGKVSNIAIAHIAWRSVSLLDLLCDRRCPHRTDASKFVISRESASLPLVARLAGGNLVREVI
jgi:hypothetical protein